MILVRSQIKKIAGEGIEPYVAIVLPEAYETPDFVL